MARPTHEMCPSARQGFGLLDFRMKPRVVSAHIYQTTVNKFPGSWKLLSYPKRIVRTFPPNTKEMEFQPRTSLFTTTLSTVHLSRRILTIVSRFLLNLVYSRLLFSSLCKIKAPILNIIILVFNSDRKKTLIFLNIKMIHNKLQV